MSDWTIELGEDVTLKIEQEQYVDENDNPRGFDGNIGVMICAHRRYNLGDEQIGPEDRLTEITCPACEGAGEIAGNLLGFDETETCPKCDGAGEIELGLHEYLKRERGARVILPLGLLDHSGISMYVGAGEHRQDPGGWDSGQVGVIFDTAETRAETTGDDVTDEEIERALRAEVEEYDSYLRGEIYAYVIEDEDGEILDSCGGFLGDLKYAKEGGLSAAEYHVKERRAIRERNELVMAGWRQ
ncbi:MAG: hypothetical protein H0U59_11845 [Gemmatimonadaceae bacterium]|nr:hypothetical protein [Gemmatimonadaceae bacterium]